MMRGVRILTTLVLAIASSLATGCSDSLGGDGGDYPDAGVSGDAGGCSAYITFDPAQPIAGPDTTVRAIANVSGFSGVPTYNWMIVHDSMVVDPIDAQPDGSQVTFATPSPGVYTVTLNLSGGSSFCPSETVFLNVVTDGGVTSYRLRVNAVGAPPQERTLIVPAGVGEYSFGGYVLDPGTVAMGNVRSGATGVASYLRFIPQGHTDVIVEAFAGPSGAFEVRVLDQQHDVLVVPAVAGYAPRLVRNWAPGDSLVSIGAGSIATGVVTAPNGTGLVGAKVQLSIDGVPSTLTTTTAGGAFSVRYEPKLGALVGIDVSPPASSALPRLSSSSLDFVLDQPIQVTYDSGLVLRDLAGVVVKRGGIPLANEKVSVVGTVSGAGTVVAGATANATGTVRVSGLTNASGALPSLRAPPSPLNAVVEIATHDLAVVPLDLTSGLPTEIVAPPLAMHSAVVLDTAGMGLPDVTIVAAPAGPLAAAGAEPLETTTTSGGAFTLPFATGAEYDLRISDAAGRGAAISQRVIVGLVMASFTLPLAVRVIGSISLSGSPNPVAGASVQVLCRVDCIGIDRTRPLAEAASENSGAFRIAVPDPGP